MIVLGVEVFLSPQLYARNADFRFLVDPQAKRLIKITNFDSAYFTLRVCGIIPPENMKANIAYADGFPHFEV
jgi:hypothetical protein